MKILGQLLLTLLSIAYPLLWFYGREQGLFYILAFVMCVLWLIRALVQKNQAQRMVSLSLAIFFIAIIVFKRPDSMYWYPVAVNLLMLIIFASSLLSKQTIIERIARLQHPDLPPEGIRHTRIVTQIWCVFFIINGTIAALLVLSNKHDWWVIYTGIISYILMGILFSGEWIYRKLILNV